MREILEPVAGVCVWRRLGKQRHTGRAPHGQQGRGCRGMLTTAKSHGMLTTADSHQEPPGARKSCGSFLPQALQKPTLPTP